MNQSRKTWASAAVVGVVVAGGVWVAAAASAGRLDQVRQSTRAVVEQVSPPPSEPTDIVVSTGVNPDPEDVLQYWTDERLEDAQPMPMPEVGEFEIGE
ncbi:MULTISPECIES: hypothetical protein [Nonomuraea]|uniref:Uncharacterized protein n=2 Tax=Nonomuraea TaxID=83681 RepID=A0ABW1BP92_9ACTN|nr:MULTISPECIES: hypothetical protein [Nonomuraea]MDA0641827.1 hypothetical protein [Nonomuraea ferruginea]TXK41149.1 hypothetical protein FR742_17630 [Nonomuraea sp. C10]